MESTGRTAAEHVTGTGMAQLAIDRHAASATRQAVTAQEEGIMSKVITYRFSYSDRTVDLCERHTNAYEYSLGPVQHGLHRGECAVCSAAICRGGDDCTHQTYHRQAGPHALNAAEARR